MDLQRCDCRWKALDFWAERDLNIVAVDEALEELELADPRQAQIVELRFFAGLTVDEIAFHAQNIARDGEARLGDSKIMAPQPTL